MPRCPLSTLDVVSWVMDRPERPLDFTLILHSPRLPDAEALRAGARSALNRYPVTASTIEGAAWTRRADTAPDFVQKTVSSEAAARDLLEEWIDSPLDLRAHVPARQLLIAREDDRTSILATRFHHAAADGRSASMWLTHQFDVASGHERPVADSKPFQPPALRFTEKRDRANGSRGSREPLWHRPGARSRKRRWHTIQFACGDLRRRVRATSAFTYNDALAAVALETCVRWNRSHSRDGSRVALWLPVEIRKGRRDGFGNGTSRIRVHAPFEVDDPFPAKCGRVHEVISGAMRSGEWRVPDKIAVLHLPARLMRPLLRGYLSRPWADVGSTAFSHVEHANGRLNGIPIDRIECVGPLHHRHACAMYGVTRHDSTWITFTYDPALLTDTDVDEMAATYRDRIQWAERELTCAV
jgi:hypothetical protein